MDCKDVEQLLSGKSLSQLSPEQQAQVAAHAAECSTCQQKWHLDLGTQELKDVIQSLRTGESVKSQVMAEIRGEDTQAGESEKKAGESPKTIGGFELIGKLGRGGMGTVFKARQISMDRTVALNCYQHSLFFSTFSTFVNHTMLIPRFTANILFIQFNNTRQCRNKLRAGIHHFPHGMGHFPGTFLRDADPFAQNNRGDTLA